MSFLRIGISGHYRFASGVDLAGLSNGDVSGPGGGVQLKFGVF